MTQPPDPALVRPDWVRRFNLFGDAVGDPRHLVDLDADRLLEAAVATTGLSDFGDAEWEAPFRAVMAGLEDDANLNLIGRVSARAETLRCLQTRLRLNDLWSREPAIRADPVVAPVFVLGPPRTGTSILLELLSLDPNLRPVIAHEAHHPLGPVPGVERTPLELSEPEQEFWADIHPEFMTMHELRSDLPCECVHFCAPDFRSWHWPMMHTLGDMEARGITHDFSSIYAWHSSFLQTLQHLDGEPATFLLKSPAHLGSLADLLAVYPDARMIHTHRDPAKFVGSGANITKTLHWLRSDVVDPSTRGPMMVLAYQLMLGLVMGQRSAGEIPPDQMADLHFRDLMIDPVHAIRRAYDHLDIEFPAEMAESVPRYLADKPAGKFGRHHYDAAALGLDESVVHEQFADYIARYDIELES